MDRKTRLRALGAVMAGAMLFSLGVVVGARQFFPYDQLVSLKRVFVDEDKAAAPSVPPAPGLPGTERVERQFRKQLPRLLKVTSTADARATRRRLAAYVWGASLDDGWGRRAVVERDVAEPPGTPDSANAVDRLAVRMPWGVESTAYLLAPARSTRSLVIYHEGHEGAATLPRQIDYFLRTGHAVLAMQMPLTGRNNRPLVQTRLGPIQLRTHNHLGLLNADRHNPLGLFFEPVRAMVTALSPEYDRIAMVGFSGGGWTTMVYAAIDPRISKSYPVAGSLPFSLLPGPGDWEHSEPGLISIASHPDLYVLGAAGRGRSQLQILNERDPCCFAGTAYSVYEEAVKQRVRAVGLGRFDVQAYSDPGQHALTEQVLRLIGDDLR